MDQRPLDIDAVRTFVRIAETGSFTRAAEVMGTTQSTVSLKLQRLERRLQCRLLDRTPRHVHLSQKGAAFLERARRLLEAHDQAITVLGLERRRLAIGISDHVAGPDLPTLIREISAASVHLCMEVHIGSSMALLARYDRRELDMAIVRFDAGRDDGEVIAQEQLYWVAASAWQHIQGAPLPVATMPEPCGVRRLAARLLDEAGVAWTEVFVGGGVAAIAAAVTAQLGVAALARRMAPPGVVECGKRLGLPGLPRLPIVLHRRAEHEWAADAAKALSAGLKRSVRG